MVMGIDDGNGYGEVNGKWFHTCCFEKGVRDTW